MSGKNCQKRTILTDIPAKTGSVTLLITLSAELSVFLCAGYRTKSTNNNQAYESVGAMPTGCREAEFAQIAKAAGYRTADRLKTMEDVDRIGKRVVEERGPVMWEIPVSLEVRSDLGRPKESARENKESFMEYLGR